MSDDLKAMIPEIMGFTAETWKGLCIAVGHTSGLLEVLKLDTAISVADLAKQKGYDLEKVSKWVRFAANVGIVDNVDGQVTLTTKGLLFTAASPLKDILAFVDGTAFFIKAAAAAETTFKTNQSLDKLSDGKISKDYQPRVSDNLSIALIDHFKKFDMEAGDKLLDVGCGNGSFLRALYKALPNLNLYGVDINLFAIEKAKKENIALGMTDRIKMLVGDVVEDLDEFPDNSYEWVSAINVLHFVPADKRTVLIDNLVRIAGKGVFVNLVEADASMIGLAGNMLMNLLWNDFTGFYTKPEIDRVFDELPKKYRNCEIQISGMLQGNSRLVTLLKR